MDEKKYENKKHFTGRTRNVRTPDWAFNVILYYTVYCIYNIQFQYTQRKATYSVVISLA